MEWTSGCLIGVVILVLWWLNTKPVNRFPPGPIGLPVVGYLFFLGRYPFKTFIKLGKKYGNVFSVPLGSSRVVVLNDWNAIKEAFVKQSEIFSGRPKNIIYEEVFRYQGIFFFLTAIKRFFFSKLFKCYFLSF